MEDILGKYVGLHRWLRTATGQIFYGHTADIRPEGSIDNYAFRLSFRKDIPGAVIGLLDLSYRSEIGHALNVSLKFNRSFFETFGQEKVAKLIQAIIDKLGFAPMTILNDANGDFEYVFLWPIYSYGKEVKHRELAPDSAEAYASLFNNLNFNPKN
jgi:hypothetical protein